ncbi:RNA polymerase-associated protein RapA [Mannheimia haemolytica]
MFLVGQRWLSESENNLGLGIVTSVDHRTVTINFPAAEEERVYAIAVAPLTRVQFQAGDRINSIDGWQLEVSEVVENQGAVIYLGKRVDNGEEAVLPEMLLDHKISFSKPQDRLFRLRLIAQIALHYALTLCSTSKRNISRHCVVCEAFEPA